MEATALLQLYEAITLLENADKQLCKLFSNYLKTFLTKSSTISLHISTNAEKQLHQFFIQDILKIISSQKI